MNQAKFLCHWAFNRYWSNVDNWSWSFCSEHLYIFKSVHELLQNTNWSRKTEIAIQLSVENTVTINWFRSSNFWAVTRCKGQKSKNFLKTFYVIIGAYILLAAYLQKFCIIEPVFRVHCSLRLTPFDRPRFCHRIQCNKLTPAPSKGWSPENSRKNCEG